MISWILSITNFLMWRFISEVFSSWGIVQTQHIGFLEISKKAKNINHRLPCFVAYNYSTFWQEVFSLKKIIIVRSNLKSACRIYERLTNWQFYSFAVVIYSLIWLNPPSIYLYHETICASVLSDGKGETWQKRFIKNLEFNS